MATTKKGAAVAAPKFVLNDLKSTDLWIMVRLLKRVGMSTIIQEFGSVTITEFHPPKTYDADKKEYVDIPREEWTEAQIKAEEQALVSQNDGLYRLVGMLIDHIADVKTELTELLAHGAGMTPAEIDDMDASDYIDLLVAYFDRENFKDFFMQARRLAERTLGGSSTGALLKSIK